MNKKNRKIFSDMVIKHDSTWASIEEMIEWIDNLSEQEQPVKLKLLGILGYLRLLKNNKGLVVGDVWLGEPNNPFDKSPVTIIEIKDGYVLYKYSTGGTATQKINAFKSLYKKEQWRK